MAQQERVQKPTTDTTEVPAAEVKANPEHQARGEEIKGALDDLLDEIDEVLENNAEEFVKSYVQKGGQ